MRLGRGEGRAVSATRGKGFLYTIGALGIFAAVVLLYIGFNAPKNIPGRSYFNLHAEFKDADNLTGSYQVRIGGRLVGQVLNPRVKDGMGELDLQLNPEAKKYFNTKTTLRVRPRSPVGVRFVDVTPGVGGQPLKEGDTIPASKTSETVQIDEALSIFDSDHRAKAQTFLNQLGIGFLSRGEDNNASIHDAPAFEKGLTDIMGAINDRHGAPQRFVAGAQGAANAAEPVRETIQTGWQPEAMSLHIFVKNGDFLRHDLDVLPPALNTIRGGLPQVNPVLDATTRFARDAQPFLRNAVPALMETSALLRDSHTGLRDLTSTAKLLNRAVNPTLALLNTVKPVLPNLETAFNQSLAPLAELTPRECDINRFFGNWESMLSYGNDAGSGIRLNLVGSGESLGVQGPATAKLMPGIFQNPYPKPCVVGSGTEPVTGNGYTVPALQHRTKLVVTKGAKK